MKPEIKKQYDLMTKSLCILRQIETIESLFQGIDNEYKEKRIDILQTEYAETMAELAGELAKVAKVKVIIHDEISY